MFTAENSSQETERARVPTDTPKESPMLQEIPITKDFDLFNIKKSDFASGARYFLKMGEDGAYRLRVHLTSGKDRCLKLKPGGKAYNLAQEIMNNGEEATWLRLQTTKQIQGSAERNLQ